MRITNLLYTIAIVTTLLGSLLAQPQERPSVDKIRSDFKREVRKDDINKRRAAIRLMRATEDPKAVKELLTQLHIAGREREKLDKKLAPMIAKRAEVLAELDNRADSYFRQNPGADGIPSGLVANLIKDRDEWNSKIGPFELLRRVEDNSYRMLLSTMGDLVTSLAEEDQQEQTKFLLDQYDKVRKVEDKAVYIEILGYVHNPQSVIGLVAIVANDSDPALRVAALSALERLGDPAAVKAARFALKDEHWPVRSAAVEAASTIASIDMIPILIGMLEKEDGRLKGDIVNTLELLSGVSYADNAPLWKKWWEENSEKLTELMADVNSDSDSQRALGLEKMEAHGFLLAAQRFLDQMEMSAAALRRLEAHRLVDPEIRLKDRMNKEMSAEADDRLLAIGRTIRSRDKEVGEKAFEEYVMKPFGITFDEKKRLQLIELMGHVGNKDAREVLASMLQKRDGDDLSVFNRQQEERARQGRSKINWRWNVDERLAAIRSLGFCAGEDEIDMLVKLFSDFEADREVLTHAARALIHIDTSRGIRSLIRCMGEIDSMQDDRRKEMVGIQKLLGDALRKATGLTNGDKTEEWLAWWDQKGADFKTEAEKEREANPEVAAAGDLVGTRFYGIRTYSKRIVFILDVSGSMEEKAEYESSQARKIDVAKEELTKAIASLPADALFNIVFYSTEAELWKKTLVEADAATKKAAKIFVSEREPGGGTNIYEPLIRAFDLAGRGSKDKDYGETSVDTIYFLSDGQPTAGRITDPEDILREVRDLNKLKKVQIHTIGIGKGHSAQFMRLLAEGSGGQYIAR